MTFFSRNFSDSFNSIFSDGSQKNHKKHISTNTVMMSPFIHQRKFVWKERDLKLRLFLCAPNLINLINYLSKKKLVNVENLRRRICLLHFLAAT